MKGIEEIKFTHRRKISRRHKRKLHAIVDEYMDHISGNDVIDGLWLSYARQQWGFYIGVIKNIDELSPLTNDMLQQEINTRLIPRIKLSRMERLRNWFIETLG